MGLIVTVAILVFFGFLLSWVAQIVAHEEVQIGTGVVIVVVSGMAGYAATLLLSASLGVWLVAIAQLVVFAGVIALLLVAIAKLKFKHAGIIAGIYTGLYLLIIGATTLILKTA